MVGHLESHKAIVGNYSSCIIIKDTVHTDCSLVRSLGCNKVVNTGYSYCTVSCTVTTNSNLVIDTCFKREVIASMELVALVL